jgi:hypothetical protein
MLRALCAAASHDRLGREWVDADAPLAEQVDELEYRTAIARADAERMARLNAEVPDGP